MPTLKTDSSSELEIDPEKSGATEASPASDDNQGQANQDGEGQDNTDKSDETKEVTLADVVQDVLKEPGDADDSSKSADGQKSESDATDEADESSDKKGDEKDGNSDENLPFHNHPRWQEVTKENKALKQEVEALKPNADFGTVINDHMQATGLTTDHLSELMQIGAAALSDPASAIPRVREFLQQLENAAGASLSPELQARVDQGLISDEDALALSKATAQATRLQTQNERLESQSREEMQAREAQATQDRAANTANDWEQAQRQKDPSFEHRSGFVSAEASKIISEMTQAGKFKVTPQGFPIVSPDLVTVILDEADNRVKRSLSNFSPVKDNPKPEIKPSPLSKQASAAAPAGAPPRKDPAQASSLSEALWGEAAKV